MCTLDKTSYFDDFEYFAIKYFFGITLIYFRNFANVLCVGLIIIHIFKVFCGIFIPSIFLIFLFSLFKNVVLGALCVTTMVTCMYWEGFMKVWLLPGPQRLTYLMQDHSGLILNQCLIPEDSTLPWYLEVREKNQSLHSRYYSETCNDWRVHLRVV